MTEIKKTSTHFKRWITGLTALPLLIAFVILGGAVFAGLVAAASIFGLWEYFRIVLDDGDQAFFDPICLAGYIAAAVLVGFGATCKPGLIPAIVALDFVVVAVYSVFRFSSDQTVVLRVARQVQGIIYVPLLLSLLVLLRNRPDGMTWIFVLLAIIFAGDTSAYYVGSYLGRNKLAPAVSPGKTVEGALGGLGANLLVGSVAKLFFLPQGDWLLSCAGFVLFGAAGQAGDLFESALKRLSNIKDSSAILPGHGGILDRIDALLLAAPVAYFWIEYVL
jgi:phosphatidate cytidylyltransferase